MYNTTAPLCQGCLQSRSGSSGLEVAFWAIIVFRFFFLFKCKFYRRVGLVSGVQQNESALHTPVYPSFSRCFPTQAITEQMCCLHLWLALGTACPLQAQHCPPRLSPSLGTLTQWPWKGDLERVEVGGHFPHDIHLCRTVRLERMFWKPELLLNYLYLL